MTDTSPYVRPDVRAFLDGIGKMRMPEMNAETIAMIRAAGSTGASMLDVEARAISVRRDLTAPGPAGAIAVRLYDARADRGPGPVVVYYHGGGFVVGDIGLFESLAIEMAHALDLPVVSVEYRLAPENPFPAAPDDAEAAARWVASAPAALGREATAIVLAGDSAGANLAIVTALALREAPARVPVAALFALYPALGRQRDYPSYAAFSEGYMLTDRDMRFLNASYAADDNIWRGRPADADMAGMPPTLVVTAALDPLRDEGRAFAGKLAAAGVPVSYREAAGNIHGFAVFRRAIPSSADDLAGALAVLKPMIAESAARDGAA